LDPKIEDESGEIRVQNTQFQTYTEASRSGTDQLSKYQEVSPWYCRENAANPGNHSLDFDTWRRLVFQKILLPI